MLFICVSLCFTNLYGYYKCRGDHHKKLKDLKSKYGAKGLMTIAGKFMWLWQKKWRIKLIIYDLRNVYCIIEIRVYKLNQVNK